MQVLIGERAQGKTYYLVQKSAAGEGTIVTCSKQHALHVKNMAKRIKLDIPEPICWDELMQPGRRSKGPYLLDEIGGVLAQFNIKIATLDAGCVEKLP